MNQPFGSQPSPTATVAMTSTGAPSPDLERPENLDADYDDDSDYDSDGCSTISKASFYSLMDTASTGSASSLDLSELSLNGSGEGYFREEYNRRYHAYHSWRWLIPDDEQEQDRMQIVDQMMSLQLNGELYTAPLSNPYRILDVGTGTGNWACEMSYKFPNARVFGLDLSAIQIPAPPNVRWDIADADERWTYPPNYFSMIHTRNLLGGISDWSKFFERAFNHLHPGGWIELHETPYKIYADNPDVSPDLAAFKCNKLFREAMKSMGYDAADEVLNFKDYLARAGFVEIEETRIQVPVGPWKNTPREKQIGTYFMLSLMEAAEGYLLAPLHRSFGMDPDEVRRMAADVRKDVLNKKHRLYMYLHIIRARKPTACEVLAPTVRPQSASSIASSSESNPIS